MTSLIQKTYKQITDYQSKYQEVKKVVMFYGYEVSLFFEEKQKLFDLFSKSTASLEESLISCEDQQYRVWKEFVSLESENEHSLCEREGSISTISFCSSESLVSLADGASDVTTESLLPLEVLSFEGERKKNKRVQFLDQKTLFLNLQKSFSRDVMEFYSHWKVVVLDERYGQWLESRNNLIPLFLHNDMSGVDVINFFRQLES